MSAKLMEIKYTFETSGDGSLEISREVDDYLRIQLRGEEVCLHVQNAGALIRTIARLCDITSLDIEDEL